MARGKKTCRILKEIRRQIADANGIEYVTSECRYRGDCSGTCPRCEAEVRYLEQQLRARSLAGKAVALAGISASALTMFMPVPADAQIRPEPNDSLKGRATVVRDTVVVKGTVVDGDTLSDGSVSKEPLIGVMITSRYSGERTFADIDGVFSIPTCVGDTLAVEYVGYEPQEIVVTEGMTDITVALGSSEGLIGEIVLVVPSEALPEARWKGFYYLDLNVVDEHGDPIAASDISVERILTDKDGRAVYVGLSPWYIDEKHPCRLIWNEDSGLRDDNGLGAMSKRATLRIRVKGYDDPVIIKVKAPNNKARKTVKFRHKKRN